MIALDFKKYDFEEYRAFLKAKASPESFVRLDETGIAQGLNIPERFAHLLDVQVVSAAERWLPLNPSLYDDQREILKMALEAERFAVWSDCGLGKMFTLLEFSRQVQHVTGGRVLIITLNDLIEETLAEARKWYGDSLPIQVLESRADMRTWCAASGSGIAITNYEKMNPDESGQVVLEMKKLAGLVLDESSRLKCGGGKQKWAIIKSARGIRYKLSCTATPAPNDVMEFASQAAFLERMRNENEIIWTWFTRNKDTNEWEVKRHARPHFFRWMASWSIYLSNPRRFGWRLDVPPVPVPVVELHEVQATPEQIRILHAAVAEQNGMGDLFGDKRLGLVTQTQLLEAARGFIYRKDGGHDEVPSGKPVMVADIARRELGKGHQGLVWVNFDAEGEIIAEELSLRKVEGFAVLSGKTPKPARQRIIAAFKAGEIRCLIAKPRMLGYGQNFQMCRWMVFSGFTDSFEDHYQALRRSYRHGQTEALRVYIVAVRPLEGPVLNNLLEKQDAYTRLVTEQEEAYLNARKSLML